MSKYAVGYWVDLNGEDHFDVLEVFDTLEEARECITYCEEEGDDFYTIEGVEDI